MYYYEIFHFFPIPVRTFKRYRIKIVTFGVRKVVETGLCLVCLVIARWRCTSHFMKLRETYSLLR